MFILQRSHKGRPMPDPPTIWVDAHVHLSFFNRNAALDWALWNFQRAAGKKSDIGPVCGVLCLAENPDDAQNPPFWQEADFIENQVNDKRNRAWRILKTKEPESATAVDGWGNRLVLIRGFQVQTREKLELLALLTNHPPENKTPFKAAIESAIEHNALTVIPWGAGKWLGKRGKMITDTLFKQNYDRPVCLGDNGGRPAFWKHVPQFKRAEDAGIPVLRGSDPLPLAWEVKRLGGFGFKIDGELDVGQPAASLKNLILEQKTRIQNFGRLEKPFSFLRNQILVRLKKIRNRAPALSHRECRR